MIPGLIEVNIVFAAIAVYFAATTIATLGHVMMKKHADAFSTNLKSTAFFLRYKYMLAALALFVGGGIIDVAINRMIPFFIRACFAALDIPIFVILARFILREVMDYQQILGVVIAVVGCSFAVGFGTHEVVPRSKQDLLQCLLSNRVAILLAVTLPMYLGSSFAVNDAVSRKLEFTGSKRFIYLTCAVFASAFSATWASLMVRAVSELAHHDLFDLYTVSASLILVLTCILQLGNMSDMHALFNSIVSMPFYLITNSLGLILLSGAIFDEKPAYPVVFTLSMILGFLGIALIVQRNKSTTQKKLEADEINQDEYDRLIAQ